MWTAEGGGENARLENARLENARADWLWKADQAQTADTLPDVNLRGMTAPDSG